MFLKKPAGPAPRLAPEQEMVPVVFKSGGRTTVTRLVAKTHFERGELKVNPFQKHGTTRPQRS